MINLRGVSEDKVFEYYYKYRIVMSPEHYHDGSGWFRNRYALANLSGSVIIEDYKSAFGESYAIERKTVNDKTIEDLFEQQNIAYNDIIMSKEEIKEALNTVLERVL